MLVEVVHDDRDACLILASFQQPDLDKFLPTVSEGLRSLTHREVPLMYWSCDSGDVGRVTSGRLITIEGIASTFPTYPTVYH